MSKAKQPVQARRSRPLPDGSQSLLQICWQGEPNTNNTTTVEDWKACSSPKQAFLHM
ncbi:MAG: EspF repeat-containing protein [Candidatus Micrarchaeia archaeon]